MSGQQVADQPCRSHTRHCDVPVTCCEQTCLRVTIALCISYPVLCLQHTGCCPWEVTPALQTSVVPMTCLVLSTSCGVVGTTRPCQSSWPASKNSGTLHAQGECRAVPCRAVKVLMAWLSVQWQARFVPAYASLEGCLHVSSVEC
jgi:hypothetical protein